MSIDDRGRRAGSDARHAAGRLAVPDLEAVRRARRRRAVVMTVGGLAMALVVAIAGAAWLRPGEPVPVAGDTTTTTTVATSSTTVAPPTTASTTTTTEPPPSQPPLPGPPRVGGEVAVGGSAFEAFPNGFGNDPAPFNPLFEGTFTIAAFQPLIFAGATDVDPVTGDYVPDLLETIPSVENGDVVVDSGRMRVNFRIDPAATWEDGTPVTAEDFRFTWQVLTNSDLPIRQDLREDHALIDGIEPIDATSFVATFSQPTIRYLSTFPIVLPAHQVAGSDLTEDWNDRPWLSAGPFRFVGWDLGTASPIAGEARFERNPQYWRRDPDTGLQLPLLDAVVFRFYQADDVGDPRALGAFGNRSVDVVLEQIIGPWNRHKLSLSEADVGAALLPVPGSVLEHADFQFGDGRNEVNPESLNDYLDFRLAVAAAIDRDAIAAELGTEAVPSLVRLAVPRLDPPTWRTIPSGEAAVREALDRLAADLGRDFASDPPVLRYVTSDAEVTRQIGDAVVAMLGAAGFDAEATYDTNFFWAPSENEQSPFERGAWDLGAWRWVGFSGYDGALDLLALYDPTNEDADFGHWGDAEPEEAAHFTTLLAEAEATVDLARFEELLVEAEQILAERMALIPLVLRGSSTTAVWLDAVAGVDPQRGLAPVTWNIERWYRNTG